MNITLSGLHCVSEGGGDETENTEARKESELLSSSPCAAEQGRRNSVGLLVCS